MYLTCSLGHFLDGRFWSIAWRLCLTLGQQPGIRVKLSLVVFFLIISGGRLHSYFLFNRRLPDIRVAGDTG